MRVLQVLTALGQGEGGGGRGDLSLQDTRLWLDTEVAHVWALSLKGPI